MGALLRERIGHGKASGVVRGVMAGRPVSDRRAALHEREAGKPAILTARRGAGDRISVP
ncbi:hypothetical protein GCM10010273_64960 [Streptomyces lavendulocolor]